MVSKRLSTGDIKNELEDLPGWKVEGDTIVRTFTFSDFVEAFAFMDGARHGLRKVEPSPQLVKLIQYPQSLALYP
jgi:4a-hydroxytetrahydrobiopterin dehydratase